MTNRPFVFLSTAMSLDGKISTADQNPHTEICTDDDYELRWKDRIDADAILIGAGQLRLDDPKLTVKTDERRQQRIALGKSEEAIKVAVVTNLQSITNRTGDFFSTGDKKVLFTTEKTSSEELDNFKGIADVYVCGTEKVDLPKAMEKLYELGIRKVMVEGGGELIFSMLAENLVDEIHLKIGNLILGGRSTTTFVDGDGFLQKAAKRVEIVDLVQKDNYLLLKCKVK